MRRGYEALNQALAREDGLAPTVADWTQTPAWAPKFGEWLAQSKLSSLNHLRQQPVEASRLYRTFFSTTFELMIHPKPPRRMIFSGSFRRAGTRVLEPFRKRAMRA